MKYKFKKGDYVVVEKMIRVSLESKQKMIGQVLRIINVSLKPRFDDLDANEEFNYIYEDYKYRWCKEELRLATKEEIHNYIKEHAVDEL